MRYLNREQLLDVVEESNRLLSLDCSLVTSSIPVEIWKTILSTALNQFSSIYLPSTTESLQALQSTLQGWSCVSRLWSSLSRNLVRDYFIEKKIYSNWVLRQFDDLTALTIDSYPCNIQIETILKMTNLSSLSLRFLNITDDKNINVVTEFPLSQMTNLTCLDLSHSRMCLEGVNNLNKENISNTSNIDQSFFYLTKLAEFSLRFNPCITDNVAKYLSHLTKLSLQNCSLTNEFLKNLTNLKSLSLRG